MRQTSAASEQRQIATLLERVGTVEEQTKALRLLWMLMWWRWWTMCRGCVECVVQMMLLVCADVDDGSGGDTGRQ